MDDLITKHDGVAQDMDAGWAQACDNGQVSKSVLEHVSHHSKEYQVNSIRQYQKLNVIT